MPFERPTLAEIKARVSADIVSHLQDSDPELRRGNLEVLARMEAGAVHGLHGLAQRLSLQILPDSAEADYLERHGGIWGVSRKAATAAAGLVNFSGTNGAVIPAGAELKRADGQRYVVLEAATVGGGAATVRARALVCGAEGNATANTGLTMTTYVTGVNPRGKAAAGGIGGGADAESDAELRARIVARIQQPPMGGAAHDYVAWAKQVSGVTRAWVWPGRLGPGTVGVTFLLDGRADPLPNAEDLALVRAHIETKRPVCAQVTVFGCVARPVNLALRVYPDTSAVRQAVAEALADLFRFESTPEGVLLISHIRQAISLAVGERDHEVISPTANVAAGPGELLTLGQIAWS